MKRAGLHYSHFWQFSEDACPENQRLAPQNTFNRPRIRQVGLAPASRCGGHFAPRGLRTRHPRARPRVCAALRGLHRRSQARGRRYGLTLAPLACRASDPPPEPARTRIPCCRCALRARPDSCRLAPSTSVTVRLWRGMARGARACDEQGRSPSPLATPRLGRNIAARFACPLSRILQPPVCCLRVGIPALILRAEEGERRKCFRR